MRSRNNNNDTGILGILAGIGAGAALMYFLDPAKGERRRSLVGDQINSAVHSLPEAAQATKEDFKNRAYGFYREARDYFTSDEDVSDRVIEARVRTKLGRTVSHPSALQVYSQDGNVTVSGEILSDEVSALLSGVKSVKGVEAVDNNMKVFNSPGDVPSLQGNPGSQPQWEYFQENWSPAARFLAGSLGGGALIYGLIKRDALSFGAATLGAMVLARSATNMKIKNLIGYDAGRGAITVHKAINVNAPVENIYSLWSNFENFPKFMSNVEEVRNLGGGRSHWKVSSPIGVPSEWDARITKVEPNSLIAWKSIKGSELPNSGIVQFIPAGDGTIQVDVQLSYTPPAGAIGHAIATMFGSDPKTQMDEDLMRMKTFIETGEKPHDAAAKSSSEQSHTKTAG